MARSTTSRPSADQQQQGSLLLLDSPLYGEIRGERSLMAFPFFGFSKNA